jgi:hypothetical protein
MTDRDAFEPGRRPARPGIFAGPRPVTTASQAALSKPEVFDLLRLAAEPFLDQVRLEEDEYGGAAFVAERDMLHLEADALNDRLAAWVSRHVDLPGVHADVSFRNAVPDESGWAEDDKDHETHWRRVAARLRLDLEGTPARATVVLFAALLSQFLEIVESRGRPAGWRDPSQGNVD